ncbi:MAG: hypothetical protein Q9183_002549 [Haloplaca sp. 2 TL-2023]
MPAEAPPGSDARAENVFFGPLASCERIKWHTWMVQSDPLVLHWLAKKESRNGGVLSNISSISNGSVKHEMTHFMIKLVLL